MRNGPTALKLRRGDLLDLVSRVEHIRDELTELASSEAVRRDMTRSDGLGAAERCQTFITGLLREVGHIDDMLSTESEEVPQP